MTPPMSVEDAIRHLFLFSDMDTNEYSVTCRRFYGDCGVTEPEPVWETSEITCPHSQS